MFALEYYKWDYSLLFREIFSWVLGLPSMPYPTLTSGK